MKTFEEQYLSIVITQFAHFKERAELAFNQLSDDELHWKPSEESNHLGQILYIGKQIKDKEWTTLSIAKTKSK